MSNRGYSQPSIYVIGDSHVSMYSGWDRIIPKWPEENFVRCRLPYFQAIRLGPVLAYNLCEYGKASLGRERLMLALSCIPASSKVLLCFGEIDCRAHLLKQAAAQYRSVDDLVKECVDRYFGVVTEVREKGFEVLVASVIPSGLDGIQSNPEYPHYGSSAERNAVTSKFNCHLELLCAKHSVFFLNITTHLLAENGAPRAQYFLDGVHLSHRSLVFAIDLLRSEFPTLQLGIPLSLKFRLAAAGLFKRLLDARPARMLSIAARRLCQ